ncbi:MAG: hypothetical protein N2544_14915 [Burkholderiales bacterium]|nr:hypothetical protein [Burkholderiales bacterium]
MSSSTERAAPRGLAALALAAALAGCAVNAPAPPRPAGYGDAGRLIGAHLGTRVLAERCAGLDPELARDLDAALAGWRWRNDGLVADVERRMWATVAAGASPAELEAARSSFARTLEGIAAELADWFRRWPADRQTAFCGRLAGRLALGEDDLERRYPAELRRWQGATR